MEFLPTYDRLPDALGALVFMTRQPESDPTRNSIMGFSWAEVVCMLTATAQARTWAALGPMRW